MAGSASDSAYSCTLVPPSPIARHVNSLRLAVPDHSVAPYTLLALHHLKALRIEVAYPPAGLVQALGETRRHSVVAVHVIGL
jgi:hypothetical protein